MNLSKSLLRFVALPFCMMALAAHAADDAARIRAGTESWVKSFNAGNASSVVALYAEDAVLMPPGAAPARGTAAIKEAISKEIAGAKKGGVTFVLGTNDEVGVSGDMAWHSGAYFIMDKAGKPVEQGKFLEAWERKGGKWRVVRDIWNADGAPGTSPPPAPAAPAPAAAPKKK
jgi:ketosteroid isomerase-like protein